jgi:hypothetical protein
VTATLTIRDETTAGKIDCEWTLDFLTECITVRELIRSRVYQEVQDYNLRQPQTYIGLVQPSDAERTINGVRLKTPRQIDWHRQYETACKAFETGRVLILVGDRQCESLEDQIEIKVDSVVSFLKLTPLVGG